MAAADRGLRRSAAPNSRPLRSTSSAVRRLSATAVPRGPYGVDAYGRPLSDKSKLVAGLLQLFLGTLGIGRFYLGYTGLGVAMLLLSWLTCGIWPLVDAILILLGRVPDSDGRTLRD